MNELESRIKSAIRNIPDFPEEGVQFKDITPLLHANELFQDITNHLCERYRDWDIDHIAAIESRGFIFGGALSHALGTSLSLVRKPGKLPYESYSVEYDLEYGTDELEMHVDATHSGARVLVIDDILATGGTCAAAVELVEQCGADVIECVFALELGFLNGRDKLDGYDIYSLANYEE